MVRIRDLTLARDSLSQVLTDDSEDCHWPAAPANAFQQAGQVFTHPVQLFKVARPGWDFIEIYEHVVFHLGSFDYDVYQFDNNLFVPLEGCQSLCLVLDFTDSSEELLPEPELVEAVRLVHL